MGVERGGKQGQGSTRRLQAMQGLRESQQLAFEPIFGCYRFKGVSFGISIKKGTKFGVECLCQGNPAPSRIKNTVVVEISVKIAKPPLLKQYKGVTRIAQAPPPASMVHKIT